jgi:hypothetical protein
MSLADDKNVLQRVRIRAAEEDTSVNAGAQSPEPHAGAARRRHAAIQRLLVLSETAKTARGATRWTRDELHDR